MLTGILNESSLIFLDPLPDADLALQSTRIRGCLHVHPIVQRFLDSGQNRGEILWKSNLDVSLDLLFKRNDMVLNLATQHLGENCGNLQRS